MEETNLKIESTPVRARIVLHLDLSACFCFSGKLMQLVSKHSQGFRAAVERDFSFLFRDLDLQKVAWLLHGT